MHRRCSTSRASNATRSSNTNTEVEFFFLLNSHFYYCCCTCADFVEQCITLRRSIKLIECSNINSLYRRVILTITSIRPKSGDTLQYAYIILRVQDYWREGSNSVLVAWASACETGFRIWSLGNIYWSNDDDDFVLLLFSLGSGFERVCMYLCVYVWKSRIKPNFLRQLWAPLAENHDSLNYMR